MKVPRAEAVRRELLPGRLQMRKRAGSRPQLPAEGRGWHHQRNDFLKRLPTAVCVCVGGVICSRFKIILFQGNNLMMRKSPAIPVSVSPTNEGEISNCQSDSNGGLR